MVVQLTIFNANVARFFSPSILHTNLNLIVGKSNIRTQRSSKTVVLTSSYFSWSCRDIFSFFSILIVDFCSKFWNKEINRFKIIVVKTYCGLRSKIGPEIDEDRLVRSSCNYDSSWRTNPIFGDFQMYLWHFVFHQIVFNHILFKFSFFRVHYYNWCMIIGIRINIWKHGQWGNLHFALDWKC